jgi:hypothetical protein
MGKHGILEIMAKTEGIVLERRKFDDTGNRIITRTRVQALPRLWRVIQQPQRAMGTQEKATIAERAENSVGTLRSSHRLW